MASFTRDALLETKPNRRGSSLFLIYGRGNFRTALALTMLSREMKGVHPGKAITRVAQRDRCVYVYEAENPREKPGRFLVAPKPRSFTKNEIRSSSIAQDRYIHQRYHSMGNILNFDAGTRQNLNPSMGTKHPDCSRRWACYWLGRGLAVRLLLHLSRELWVTPLAVVSCMQGRRE